MKRWARIHVTLDETCKIPYGAVEEAVSRMVSFPSLRYTAALCGPLVNGMNIKRLHH